MLLNIQRFGGRGSSSSYDYSKFSKSKIKATLYHGTGKDFESFENRHIGSSTGNNGDFGEGFYFTQNERLAEDYVRDETNNYASKGNVFEVKINTKNPFRWSSIKTEEQFNQFIKDFKIKNKDITWNRYNNEIHTMPNAKASKDFARALKKKGYDGIVYQHQRGASEYVVFNSKQIKVINKKKYVRGE